MSTDHVTADVALQVFKRDHGCMAPRLGGSFHDCAGRDGLEHVQDSYGRMGRRAPSDAAHLVVLCDGHREPGMKAGYVWCTAKENREAMRDYLADLYPPCPTCGSIERRELLGERQTITICAECGSDTP